MKKIVIGVLVFIILFALLSVAVTFLPPQESIFEKSSDNQSSQSMIEIPQYLYVLSAQIYSEISEKPDNITEKITNEKQPDEEKVVQIEFNRAYFLEESKLSKIANITCRYLRSYKVGIRNVQIKSVKSNWSIWSIFGYSTKETLNGEYHCKE